MQQKVKRKISGVCNIITLCGLLVVAVRMGGRDGELRAGCCMIKSFLWSDEINRV